MEIKKHESKKIEKKKHSFFLMGTLAALSLLLMAFEWTNTEVEYSAPFLKETLLENEKITEMKLIVKPKPKTSAVEQKTSDKVEVVDKPEEFLDTAIVFKPVFDSLDYDPNGEEDTTGDWVEPPKIMDPVSWADKTPEYPGGEKALYEHLAKEIKFTVCAKENRISGKVYLQFIIEKDGSITNIKVMRGLGCGLDENAVKAIKSMKNWKPGRQGINNVRFRFNLPINYKLN